MTETDILSILRLAADAIDDACEQVNGFNDASALRTIILREARDLTIRTHVLREKIGLRSLKLLADQPDGGFAGCLDVMRRAAVDARQDAADAAAEEHLEKQAEGL